MDKILLTTFCGLSVNGLYSMAMSFGAIYSIFKVAFDNAYIPYLQKRISKMTFDNQKAEKKQLVRISYIISSVFFLLFFVVMFICWILIQYVLSDLYRDSFQFIPWILFSLTIYSFIVWLFSILILQKNFRVGNYYFFRKYYSIAINLCVGQNVRSGRD